jgi:hypothetical protein
MIINHGRYQFVVFFNTFRPAAFEDPVLVSASEVTPELHSVSQLHSW